MIVLCYKPMGEATFPALSKPLDKFGCYLDATYGSHRPARIAQVSVRCLAGVPWMLALPNQFTNVTTLQLRKTLCNIC